MHHERYLKLNNSCTLNSIITLKECDALNSVITKKPAEKMITILTCPISKIKSLHIEKWNLFFCHRLIFTEIDRYALM